MDLLIIFGAKYLIVISVLLALCILWMLPSLQRFSYVIHIIAAGILGFVAAKILGHFYFDPRPFVGSGIAPLIPHAADNGFPSDHTLLAATLAAVATLFKRDIGVALWIVALLVGAARVAAGVHHPTDIVGSIIIAIIATTIVRYLLRKRVTF